MAMFLVLGLMTAGHTGYSQSYIDLHDLGAPSRSASQVADDQPAISPSMGTIYLPYVAPSSGQPANLSPTSSKVTGPAGVTALPDETREYSYQRLCLSPVWTMQGRCL
jgi:hypothetical protein